MEPCRVIVARLADDRQPPDASTEPRKPRAKRACGFGAQRARVATQPAFAGHRRRKTRRPSLLHVSESSEPSCAADAAALTRMNAFEAAYPPLLPASGDTPYGSDSDGEDDVIDVLSADHCAGEHSYTMPMPPSMILEAQERRAARRPAPQPELPSLSPELSAAHRLVEWMGSPVCRKYSAPFLEPMEAEQRPAYAKVVRRPMCLSRVRASLDADEYASITEVVRDLRLILENCYRFFGPSHCFSKKAQKLETVLEQKLALLPR